ncbi:MAG: endonuclease Q family protein [Paenibacillaceae bacterium]
MESYYADLHIHIGKTEEGKAVKISGSRNLTFHNIAEEASARKGIDIVGIIDCHSPGVQQEIDHYLDIGAMEELPDGGIRYHQTTVILGSEIEVRDPGMGPAHVLAYFPTLAVIKQFSKWMSRHMKNIQLSSQRIYVTAEQLQQEVIDRGGILIPAHIFTPHRSVYGSCTDRMAELLDLSNVHAVELGLSSDSAMAGLISELTPMTFLTNSDAHSLRKIAREYNKLSMKAPTYTELVKAIQRIDGRKVIANYGLNPRLGKYHRTYCRSCGSIIDEKEDVNVERCSYCGSLKIVRGVMDRIQDIADLDQPAMPDYRPPYHYQVPLEYIPGVGPKKLQLLLAQFDTEMNILHRVHPDDLIRVAGFEAAELILKAREGTLQLESGGGGTYGRIIR